MIVFVMQWLDILGIVRTWYPIVFITPAEEVTIGRSLAEPVVCLDDLVTTFSKHPFEDAPEILVREDSNRAH